ncbi:hypothetical protein HMPREF9141_2362 [Prevotella multiformis DSM 16608]|uniref:Uncharacterized protein n=1 Tax=Prevotella multiformis DSM 16608 TaxID=888743 RepID=F0F9U5_9BACT|nr:hypothetical protein HMPREF9141_2362 [Prevotella multiformis DSM 16608]
MNGRTHNKAYREAKKIEEKHHGDADDTKERQRGNARISFIFGINAIHDPHQQIR